ncbi:DUF4287 domain-containing protein [Phenylobacterium sp.]|uniref:DUF4287 domain-containing protein n=1 Tax=Phenylobacterium sp. TaxID=1871053 RepID=UPI002E3229A2|nr:DUF4287 domain-containing protein [Phenylobacterium sp.]HEX2562108.1 DUF4287 domain-containing protein [Phenylobacterium sp.]
MAAGSGLTERQQKWFASVQASLERDTGRTIDQWVAIARTCPETRPKAREKWLKEHHGLGINRASYVLSQAFPSEDRWDQPEALRAKLWTDPASTAILEEVEQAAGGLDGVVVGQRKGFTVFSRKVAFAALRPLKGGKAALGLALTPDVDPRLTGPKNDGWSERLKGRLELAGPAEVDDTVRDLLRRAWERS